MFPKLMVSAAAAGAAGLSTICSPHKACLVWHIHFCQPLHRSFVFCVIEEILILECEGQGTKTDGCFCLFAVSLGPVLTPRARQSRREALALCLGCGGHAGVGA